MYQPDRELLRLLPRVLRARDFHLYLENGKRLTDLWLHGGRAILGHKPPRVLAELKNAAERGLFTPLPHPQEKRFLKALGEFFPDRAFRLYMNEGSLYNALTVAGFTGDMAFPDPAFPSDYNAGTDSVADKASVSLWRPFVEPPDDGEPGAPILIPVLPWPLSPSVLVLDKSLEASFPAGEIIPPVLLAPATRVLYDLAVKIRTPDRQRYRKIEKVLDVRKSGESPDGSSWCRRGIYLTTNAGMEKYEILFKRFLEGGFLLPPSAREPVILPASMSKGEEAKLAELLAVS